MDPNNKAYSVDWAVVCKERGVKNYNLVVVASSIYAALGKVADRLDDAESVTITDLGEAVI